MRGRTVVASFSTALVLALALFLVPTLGFRPWFIDHFYARVFIQFALRHPLLLTQLGLPGVRFADGRLDNFSPSAAQREMVWVKRQVKILRSYDRGAMTPSARVSAEVLDWYLSDQEEGARFLFMDCPVNPVFGLQNELPALMIGSQPLR